MTHPYTGLTYEEILDDHRIEMEAIQSHVFDLETLLYDLQDKLTRIERALRGHVMHPDQPYVAAAMALDILDGKE